MLLLLPLLLLLLLLLPLWLLLPWLLPCLLPVLSFMQVIIHAAVTAAQNGCRVLIGAPIGVLVAQYRARLPPGEEIVVETIHSAFKIGRDRDAQYIPPGRLRHYDLIIFDEVSQIDAQVWAALQTALSELSPYPYVVFVWDFQQLQPWQGQQTLYMAIEALKANGKLACVELQQHEAARCNDPAMLDFLTECRTTQPSRRRLETFFGGRKLPRAPEKAARFAADYERHTGDSFTFLTVTNKGAAMFNRARLRQDFAGFGQALEETNVVGDPQCGEGKMVFMEGMRIRLTQNIDKDRGFVNGMLGTIRKVLRKDVFVLETMAGVNILVHPVWHKKQIIMPCTYGYATTMRRAQGATLGAVGLVFDKRRADRGYAYVGASRCRRADKLFLVGRVRRTDWLPVRGDPANEQMHISALSSDTDSEERSERSSLAESDINSEPERGRGFGRGNGSVLRPADLRSSDDGSGTDEPPEDAHEFDLREDAGLDEESMLGWLSEGGDIGNADTAGLFDAT